ncbi:MAG: hypothetical protein LKF70_11135 [Prevotella sp.]|jgi:hypothetical protein|nr:hypothetical protein [Prevotella sp.]
MISKEKTGKIKVIAPRDYYQKLTRKERSKFLDYLYDQYGLQKNTIRAKLAKRPISPIKPIELQAIENTIEGEKWRM